MTRFTRLWVVLSLICFALGSLQIVADVFSQGVAVPRRPARPKTTIKHQNPIPRINFQDIAAKSGLTARHVTGTENEKKYIIETTGSGVALFDYDRDGWVDIFLVNGTSLEGFPPGKEPTNHLYRNNRDGTFADVTEKTNLRRSGWGQGACVGDFDNDGADDLLVTYFGQDALYQNNGKGRFEEVTEKAGLKRKATRWSTGCSFLDYDLDGDLDLFIAGYVDFDLKNTPAKGSNQYCLWKGIPVMCGPRGLPAGTNLLYQNNGNGTFTDVSEKSGIAKPSGRYAFTSLVSDYDNDGRPDIYVACDSTPNILYHNEGDGTFTDIGLISGSAVNEDGQEQAGMGVSAGDYDHDGFFDLVKTNFADDVPTLYRNNSDGTFVDVTYTAQLGVNTRFLGWGAGFFDFDHDGWKDIFMVNGHVYPEVEQQNTHSAYKQERQVFWNLGNGTFLEVSDQAGSGISDRWSSRGAAVADLDNDGNLEIVINNMNNTPSLLKNFGERKNWVLIKTIGRKSNMNGIGARVTITAGGLRQMDEVRSGGSYISHNDLRLHFGIGTATRVDRLEVLWPSGRNESFDNLKASQIIVIEEGKGISIPRKAQSGSSFLRKTNSFIR
ncbi:MAG: CRTAC1 family protein [Acidobacteria bacterium]|nr:CRTAC1 family protein [Acidobacteriota bacterium]